MYNNKLLILCLFSIFFSMCLISSASAASTVYVNTTGSDISGNGSITDPYHTLEKGISSVSNNGKIKLSGGVFSGQNNSQIIINKNITIIGKNQKETIITTNNTGFIFYIESDVNVILTNLTFSNSKNVQNGIILNYGTLKLDNCTFSGNKINTRGTIRNYYITSINGCTFNSNTAEVGGAIINLVDKSKLANLIITDSIFKNNAAIYPNAILSGGGAIISTGNVTIIRTIFINNRAATCGGALFLLSPNANILNCIFINNTANQGSSIWNQGVMTVKYCVFKDNTAKDTGGAIYDSYLSISSNITHSTFVRNTARNGGAIYCYYCANITACSFVSNKATENGGAISCANSTIQNNDIINNTASKFGGAIFVIYKCAEINYNRIIGNTALENNAIYLNTTMFGKRINTEDNWWGSNSPKLNQLVMGCDIPKNWIILKIRATPISINNTQTSTIVASLYYTNKGNYLKQHIPDGIVELNTLWGSFTRNGIDHTIALKMSNGLAHTAFYANEGRINTSQNPVKVKASTDNYTTNSKESTYITIHPGSRIYLNSIVSPHNPKISQIFTLKYILTNSGPNNINNLAINFQIPNGLEFKNFVNYNKGYSEYDNGTKTITWKMSSVPIGTTNLYLKIKAVNSGYYKIIQNLTAKTYIKSISRSTTIHTIH